jgi:hypothetical protein
MLLDQATRPDEDGDLALLEDAARTHHLADPFHIAPRPAPP